MTRSPDPAPVSSLTKVFVYGTLKRQQLRAGVWPHPPLAIRPAIVCGSLYDLGPYPAIAAGEDWVLGELWELSPGEMPRTLEVLDAVEGYRLGASDNEYLRIITEVTLEDGERQAAFAYQIADPRHLIGKRRINAWYAFAGRAVAAWPDPQAKVAASVAEEARYR
jgi:gamma-glutamylcyclotransferase (GGCT)/AIG2-like uncharacterized protein YtfP